MSSRCGVACVVWTAPAKQLPPLPRRERAVGVDQRANDWVVSAEDLCVHERSVWIWLDSEQSRLPCVWNTSEEFHLPRGTFVCFC